MGKYRGYEVYDGILKSYIDGITSGDVKVDHYWLPEGMGGELSYACVRKLNEPYIVSSAIKAEKEGYDGFVLGCYLDPALHAVREAANIPAVSLGLASMVMVSLLNVKFAIITSPRRAAARIHQQIKMYGFEGLNPIVKGLDFDVATVVEALERPEILLEGFESASEEAVREGARVIIPGCGILEAVCIKERLWEISGVPILSSIASSIKLVEALIKLKTAGLKLDRKLYCPPPKKILEDVRRAYESYGVEV
ncbi:MAG: hypothetical protein DRO52_00840 [Candidatus Hecatellales archaeon]|nr:MAG: hypothetical protein DRO52_00840 [Candidatus Hecatellales archaeon]